MNNYSIAKILLNILMRWCIGHTVPRVESKSSKVNSTPTPSTEETKEDENKCGGFLCTGNSCKRVLCISPGMGLHAIMYILANTSCDPMDVIIPALKQDPAWSSYLDRQQVWNQARPPWLNALLDFMRPVMTPIVDTLLEAVKTGASIYQAMSLVLGCFGELHECLPLGVLQIALTMDEKIPAHCRPIGGSVLLQVMCSALYSALLEVRDVVTQHVDSIQTEVRFQEIEPSSLNTQNRSSTAIALTEALCSIDEDNKHTAQIDDLISMIRESVDRRISNANAADVEDVMCIIETYTDQLAFTEIGRSSLKIIHEYLLRTSKPLLEILRNDGNKVPDSRITAFWPVASKPLTHIMFHIEDIAFDRLLINYDDLDWEMMFEVPLAVTTQRVRAQVLTRPELINILQLVQDEREAANFVKQLCTTGVLTRRT